LRANTTGKGNTSLGAYSLLVNTTGCYNTALGDSAGGPNTTGIQNTYIGAKAIGNAATNNNQIAIGYNVAATGDSSIYIGNSANAGIKTYLIILDSTGQWTAPTGISGRCLITCDSLGFITEDIEFTFNTNGSMGRIISNDVNFVSGTTPDKMCFIDNGSGFAILNRLPDVGLTSEANRTIKIYIYHN